MRFDIYIDHSGLGDFLFYSHMPRLAKLHGFSRVRVHLPAAIIGTDKSNLIWELNPYVDEIIPNECRLQSPFKRVGSLNLHGSIAYHAGFNHDMINMEPEVYYSPQSDYSDINVFDPNFISGAGFIDSKRLMNFLASDEGLYVVQPITGCKYISGFDDFPTIKIKNLGAYFDLVCTSKHFKCLVSGGASLRPSFSRGATVFYGIGQYSYHRHSDLNDYVDVSPKITNLSPLVSALSYKIYRKLISK